MTVEQRLEALEKEIADLKQQREERQKIVKKDMNAFEDCKKTITSVQKMQLMAASDVFKELSDKQRLELAESRLAGLEQSVIVLSLQLFMEKGLISAGEVEVLLGKIAFQAKL